MVIYINNDEEAKGNYPPQMKNCGEYMFWAEDRLCYLNLHFTYLLLWIQSTFGNLKLKMADVELA